MKTLKLAALAFVILAGSALAQRGGFQNDTQSCAADRPCFNGAYQSGDRVIFKFTGICCWDFFNVRYAAVGGGEKQVENRSGSYSFTNIRPRRVYTISVQGCNSHTFARSTCSPWVQQSITTR